MDLKRGNSGNHLYSTITKVGFACAEEGAYCKFLGESVCPKIFDIFPGGYTMECLKSYPITEIILEEIEELLIERVWNRPALPSTQNIPWIEELQKFGVRTPKWAVPLHTELNL